MDGQIVKILALEIMLLSGTLVLSGCATKKYVRQQVQTLQPGIQKAQNAAKENEERVDAVDRRAQVGNTSAQAAMEAAAHALTTAQLAINTAQQSAAVAARTSDAIIQAQIETKRAQDELSELVPDQSIQTPTQLLDQRETGTSFLEKGFSEVAGYGLYSYLLFGSKPGTDENRKVLYRSAITAWMTLPSAKGLLQDQLPKELLNVFYLPILKELDLSASSKSNPVTADDILDVYDWDRASALLHNLAGTHVQGPYIISTLRPLSSARSTLSNQYLYQDLSAVPQIAVILWIREFQYRVAQERFWEERRMPQFALELRTAVARASNDLPLLSSILVWLKMPPEVAPKSGDRGSKK